MPERSRDIARFMDPLSNKRRNYACSLARRTVKTCPWGLYNGRGSTGVGRVAGSVLSSK